MTDARADGMTDAESPPDDYMNDPMPRAKVPEYTLQLEQVYPGRTAHLLIRLDKPIEGERNTGKRPLVQGWPRIATGFYEDLEHDRSGHIEKAAEWLADGGNLGWVIPPGFLLLDCDTEDVRDWVRDQLTPERQVPHSPYPHQESQPNNGHFLVRLPGDFDAEAFGGQASRYLDCGKIDLRLGGRGQVCCEPSTHAVILCEYRWLVPLPDHLETVPEIPGALLKALVDAPTRIEDKARAPGAPAIEWGPAPTKISEILDRDKVKVAALNPNWKGRTGRHEHITLFQAAMVRKLPLIEFNDLEVLTWGYIESEIDPTPTITREYVAEQVRLALRFRDRIGLPPEPEIDEDGNAKPFYGGFWAEEAEDQPVQSPIVQGVGFEGNVGVLYGPSGSLKSALALDMAAALALPNREWFGNSTAQGGTIYVAAEGGGGMRDRILALRKRFPDIPDKTIRVITQAVRLMDEEAIEKLEIDLRATIHPAMDLPILLMVFDTYSQSIPGANENDSESFTLAESHVRRCIRFVSELQSGRKPMGLLVHHPARTGLNARGSSAMEDNLDFIMSTEILTQDRFSFQMLKVKDDAAGWAKPYMKEIVPLGTKLLPKSSIVAVECDWPEDEPQEKGRNAKPKRKKRADID